MTLSKCTRDLQKQGMPHPRTCAECGLGPCKKYPPRESIPCPKTQGPNQISSEPIVELSHRLSEASEALVELCGYLDETGLKITSLTPKAKKWWGAYEMATKQTASADEIKITPAMIDAGVNALWETGAVEHPSGLDKEVVRDVFTAMIAASQDRV